MTTQADCTSERRVKPSWPPDLSRRLAERDPEIWERVIRSYRPLIYSRASQLRLKPWQRQDLEQRVWLALLENAASIRDIACLPGWLSTTARHAGIQLLQNECREISVDRLPEESVSPDDRDVEQLFLDAERLRELRKAVAQLSPRQQAVVRALLRDLSYDQLSVQLGIAIGSVGPTRQRALNRLRTVLTAA